MRAQLPIDDLPLFAWAGGALLAAAIRAPLAPLARFKVPPPPQSAIWPERDADFDLAQAAFARALRPASAKRDRTCPIVATIVECAGVVRAIGKPEIDNPSAHAWLEIDRSATFPTIKLWSRGVQIGGHEFDEARQAIRTTTRRDFSFDAVKDALDAARAALRDAGFALTAYHEARLVDPEHGIGCAIIGLRSTTPARSPHPTRSAVNMAA